MAQCVINIWDICPEVAKRIDEKYCLGVKESMDEIEM